MEVPCCYRQKGIVVPRSGEISISCVPPAFPVAGSVIFNWMVTSALESCLRKLLKWYRLGNEWILGVASLNKNLRWQTQNWQPDNFVIYFLRCVSISRYAVYFLWLEYIGNRDFYRTTLYTLIHGCTRLIQNGGVWDWQKLNSKCLLKN